MTEQVFEGQENALPKLASASTATTATAPTADPAPPTTATTTPTSPSASPSRWSRPWRRVTAAAATARRHPFGIAAIGWSTGLAGVQGARLRGWIIDDAGISFAYARSFATGHGPVVQAGAAPVEGYSNPTWVAVLAIGRLLGLFDHGAWFGIPDYELFPKAVGLLCIAGTIACFYAAALALLPGRRSAAVATAVAGTVLAFIPSYIIWCFSGLENSLYALLVTALAALMTRAVVNDRLLDRRTAVISGVLVALAALTRPDGVIYVLAYPIVVLLTIDRTAFLRAVRAVGLYGLTFAVTFGAYLAWRRAEFGLWVPNTAVAKSQQAPALSSFEHIVDLLQYPGTILSLLAIAVVVAAIVGVPTMRRPMTALVVPLALALTAYCVLEADWMNELRFATPVWALASLSTAVCVTRVAMFPGIRLHLALATSFFAALFLGYHDLSPRLPAYKAAPDAPLCAVANQNGEVFNAYADIAGIKEGTLLLPDLGGTALTSRLQLRDIAGLVDAPVARYYKTGDMNGLRNYILDVMKPTFIQVHGVWSGPLAGPDGLFDARLKRDYTVITAGGNLDGDPTQTSSNWVRTSALPDVSVIPRLQDYARSEAGRIARAAKVTMFGTCSARLTVGETPKQ